MAKYGIPYMGSKGPIADWVLSHIPATENFYDLFGGGFSVTHAAMLKSKWKSFYFNEIKTDVVDLIKKSIAGEYNYDVFKPDFVTREMFDERKATCAYTRVIWSFGNNQRNYLFGKDIEAKKRSLHDAVVFSRFDDFAKDFLKIESWPTEMTIKDRRLKAREIGRKIERLDLQQLQQLQQLERLEQLEQLQRLERLELSSMDYREVEIKENSVVYCDIPYIGTSGYGGEFDHKAFYKWALEAKFPVFTSEYYMPEEFFVIASVAKKQKLSASGKRKEFIEKIFANKAGLALFNKHQMKTYNLKTQLEFPA